MVARHLSLVGSNGLLRLSQQGQIIRPSVEGWSTCHRGGGCENVCFAIFFFVEAFYIYVFLVGNFLFARLSMLEGGKRCRGICCIIIEKKNCIVAKNVFLWLCYSSPVKGSFAWQQKNACKRKRFHWDGE